MNKNNGTKFERTDKIESNEFIAGCDGKRVIQDSEVEIIWDGKPRAYCRKVGCFLQFPNSLRDLGARYTCDIIENSQEGKKTFYRAVKDTIRDRAGNVVG